MRLPSFPFPSLLSGLLSSLRTANLKSCSQGWWQMGTRETPVPGLNLERAPIQCLCLERGFLNLSVSRAPKYLSLALLAQQWTKGSGKERTGTVYCFFLSHIFVHLKVYVYFLGYTLATLQGLQVCFWETDLEEADSYTVVLKKKPSHQPPQN